jgi:anti-sigma factor RsiW
MSAHPPMTCKRTAELLCDYQEGMLDADDKEVIDSHMAQCAQCRAFVATYRATTALCKKVLSAAVPSDLEGKLMSFLRSHKRAGKA